MKPLPANDNESVGKSKRQWRRKNKEKICFFFFSSGTVWHMNQYFHDISVVPKCFRVCHFLFFLSSFYNQRRKKFWREFFTENWKHMRANDAKMLSNCFNVLFIWKKKKEKLRHVKSCSLSCKSIKNYFQHMIESGREGEKTQAKIESKKKKDEKFVFLSFFL